MSHCPQVFSREWFINWKLALVVARFVIPVATWKVLIFFFFFPERGKSFLKGNPWENWAVCLWTSHCSYPLGWDTLFGKQKEIPVLDHWKAIIRYHMMINSSWKRKKKVDYLELVTWKSGLKPWVRNTYTSFPYVFNLRPRNAHSLASFVI